MEYNYNQCPECGYTSNKRPDVCPSCGHDLAAYRRKLKVKQEEDAKKAQEEAAYAEKDKKYKAAVALFGANQFEKARNQFLELGDFKESEKYAEKSFNSS